MPAGAQETDSSSVERGRGGGPDARPWSTLAVVGTAQMLAMLDSTVVNVALPSIGADINASPQSLQWTISGYVLAYGSLLLLGGRLADALGRRAIFLSGLTVFVIASVGAGLASSGELLVVARVAQGVGAAVLSAAALSIIVATYRSARQMNIALTVWSGLGVIGATIGVITGGLIVEYASWRWVFLVNLPIGFAIAAAALMAVAPMRRDAGAPRLPLRLMTAVAVTFSLLALSYAFIDFQEGPARVWPWIFLAVGAAVLSIVIRHERQATDPLLPLFLMNIRIFALACVGMVLAATLLLGSLYLGSNYFQTAVGLSPLQTGFALLPLCGGSLLSALAIPKFAEKVGMHRVYLSGVVVQLTCAAALAAILWTAGDSAPATAVIVVLGVFGLGLPTMFVPLYTFGAAEIPEEHSGAGSGLLNTFNESGAGIGIAIVAPIAAYVSTTRPAGTLTPIAEAHGIAAGFTALAVCALLAAATGMLIVRTVSAMRTRPTTQS